MATNKSPSVVFVISHPDDESMFFLPTLYHFCSVRKKQQCLLVCLSNGNYDGLGKTREVELHRVVGYFSNLQLTIVHHDELQDSPTKKWSPDVIEEVLNQELRIKNDTSDSNPIAVYTFDEDGVSGHCNHKDTYQGVKQFLQNTNGNFSGYKLKTVHGLFTKYFPWLHWIRLLLLLLFSLFTNIDDDDDDSPMSSYMRTIVMHRPLLNWKCMAAHASQFVWYRRLFVVFSCYTYENQWEPILERKQGLTLGQVAAWVGNVE